MKITAMLQKTSSNNRCVLLSEDVKRRLPCLPEQLAFGSRTADCTFATESRMRKTIQIPAPVWEELHVPEERLVHFIMSGKRLHIGPLIAVFTAGFTEYLERPLGSRSRFFARLLAEQENVSAFAFVFGAHRIDWQNGTIRGLFYKGDGWQNATVPFPDVVYDRLPNRKTENLPIIRETRRKLEEKYFIPWFNPGFFDKWEMIERLKNEPDVSSYLPETILHPDKGAIYALLKRHGHVYIKPPKGSLGYGIQRILQKEDGYYCIYHQEFESRLRRFATLSDLLKKQFGRLTLTGLMAQQGIHLIRHDRRPVDFRVHANKDENGRWCVTALAAKTAGPGSVTTHLRFGGRVHTLNDIFGIGPEKRLIEQKLKKAALTIAQAIEHQMPGYVGEFGFDLGIDHHLNVWLFEANAKPGRSIFSHPRFLQDEERTRRLPLAYAVFLAKETLTKPETAFVQ